MIQEIKLTPVGTDRCALCGSAALRKRCGLLNVGGFYDPLIALFDGAVKEGFISGASLDIVFATDDPRALLDHLSAPLDLPDAAWLRSTEQT